MNTVTSSSWLWDCVWQSTLFLGLGGLLSLLENRHPARAHRILLLAMVACLATPLLSEGVRRMGWGVMVRAPVVSLSEAASVFEVGHGSRAPGASLPDSSTAAAAAVTGAPDLSGPVPSRTAKTPSHLAARFPWLNLFAGAWLISSGFVLIRLLISIMKEMIVLRRAKPLHEGMVLRVLEQTTRRLELRTRPTVSLSDQVVSPVICCWGLRPAVVISQSPPRISGDEAWTGILCHELAHWKRRDHWAVLVSEILFCFLPWHPLVWWAKRRLEHLSELACDGWVVACGQPAVAYADSLLDLLPQRPSAFALPVVGLRRKLESRIRNILSAGRQVPNLGVRWAWTTMLAMLLIATMVAFAQSRSVASEAGWQTTQKHSDKSPSGLSLRLLVKGWASDFSGCPSADGRYVCEVNSELYVRDRVSGKSRPLTKGSEKAGGEPFDGVISPDNKYVAYSWYSTNTEAANELRLVKLDGSGTRVLYTEGNTNEVNPVQWSSDGKKILATVNAKGTCQLVLVSAADGSAEILKMLPNHSPSAGLSPDCRYVAYDFPQRGSTNACDVFLYDTRDKRETPLITHPADDRFLGWSLDGKWIVFSSDRWGTADLWVVQVRDGKTLDAPRLVKSNLGAIKPKGFTRNGSFYYTREFRAGDVYTASLDLDTGRLLEAPVPLPVLGDKGVPAWSHDGRFLAYSKVRMENLWKMSSTLAIYSLASGEVREFNVGEPQASVGVISGLRWSSDDRFILAYCSKDDGAQLYQIDVSSGRTTLVADAPGEGKPYVYSTAKEVEPEVVALVRDAEAARKKVREISPESSVYIPPESSVYKVSPDKQSVAFVDWDKKVDARRIMVMPLAGGAAREVVPAQRGENIWFYQIEWTTHGRDLLYVRDRNFVTSLWRVSAQGGPARQLWVTNPRLGRLDIHPDGRRIALGGSRTLQHEVWVMENFLPKE